MCNNKHFPNPVGKNLQILAKIKHTGISYNLRQYIPLGRLITIDSIAIGW